MPHRLLKFAPLAVLVAGQLLAQPAVPAAWHYARSEAGLRTLTTLGRAQTPAGPADASLNLFCKEGAGGWIGLEFTVYKADEATPGDFLAQLKTFHFDDFEGPGALASGRKLTRLEVRARSGPCQALVRQEGSYSASFSGGFVFSTGGPNRAPGSELKRVLKAIREGGDRLTLRVADSQDPQVTLAADFDTTGLGGAVKQLLEGYW